LTELLASRIDDPRQPGKVRHEWLEVFRQRVFAIAAGYEDGIDAGRLASDPALKLACGRGPVRGEDLASQSTVSRMENAVAGRDVTSGRRWRRGCRSC
jgi:hypothetical protein